MTTQTHSTMRTLKDVEGLIDLLHEMNEAGRNPSLPFVDQQGITGLAYGIDAGDEMLVTFFTDPGEDRIRDDGHDHSGSESYIGLFEHDIYELHGPIVVLIPGPDLD